MDDPVRNRFRRPGFLLRFLKVFEYAANQKSPRIGKPNRAILDLCLEYFGLKEDEIILIGDNLETDSFKLKTYG